MFIVRRLRKCSIFPAGYHLMACDAGAHYLEGILLDPGAPGLGVVTFVHAFYYHTSLAMSSRCSITTLLGLEMA